MSAVTPPTPQGFPEGEKLQEQIDQRHRSGTLWRTLFQAATIVGIIALTALIYNIINEAFGLVAVQNQNEPAELVLTLNESYMLGAANTRSSESDEVLAARIGDDANAIGFFGYAYYQENQASLRVVAVEGVLPSADTVEDGSYPLSRPLYIYTSAEILNENPAVQAYVATLLGDLEGIVAGAGYFPASEGTRSAARLSFQEALGVGSFPDVDPAAAGGPLTIAGSSTVFPIARLAAEQFSAAGFGGEIDIQNIGSTAGLRSFCVEESAAIATASRPMRTSEFEACRANGINPLELRIGTDALSVVVNPANSFLESATTDELRQIFTLAGTWQEVNPAWPADPIARYVPGSDSGTLDFFTQSLFTAELAELSKLDLARILAANVTSGRGRTLERDQRFFEQALVFENQEVWDEICAGDSPPAGCTAPVRTQEEVYDVVLREVVQPDVVATWRLVDSIFNRSEIAAEATEKYPNARLEFRSWLTGEFVTTQQSSTPENAGVRTALYGTLWVVLITMLFSFPVGVGAAIYLEEYAGDTQLNRLLQTNINNLAGVPSIIYGMLGLAIFVRALEPLTSGALFGVIEDGTTANGRTVLSAGLTLGLLILPIIIINAQEAIRAVPNSMRQAGMALGATKWQTIWHHVLPSAAPGILTGAILSMSRAIGETAPLVVVGASTFIVIDPNSPFSKFTTLPIQIYQWTARPQAEFRNIAAAAIVVLLVLLLTLNTSAVLLRNRAARGNA